jgi:PRTRC genetic system protein A
MTYANNPLDVALAAGTPVYPMAHDGTLPELVSGQHCYLLAQDGLFLYGRGYGFDAIKRLSTLAAPTPFGAITPGLRLDHGRVSVALFAHACGFAAKIAQTEWAGAITIQEDRYQLDEIVAEATSAAEVTYLRESYDDDRLIVDLHSHGEDKAYFSPTDDRCDAQGIYLAVVIGHCHDANRMHFVSRVTINGVFMALKPEDWLDASAVDGKAADYSARADVTEIIA